VVRQPVRVMRKMLSVVLLSTLLLPFQPPRAAAEAVAVPQATLSVPSGIPLGESLTFSVSFANTAAGTIGYGPYIDLQLDNGADGDDGIIFTSASVLGIELLPAADPVDCGSGYFMHPLTEQSTPCTEGFQVLVLRLPFNSVTAAQAAIEISVTAMLSSYADAGTALGVAALAGFFLGSDEQNNPTTDAPLVQATAATSSVTPILWRLYKAYDGQEDETATGPNFPRIYTLAVDIASGQKLAALRVSDVLPSSMQFVELVSVSTASLSTTYTVISTPLTTAPGGTLLLEFNNVTGSSSGSEVELQVAFYIPRLNSAESAVLSAVTGNAVIVSNTVTASATWTPADSGDPARTVTYTAVGEDNTHYLYQRAIALVKSVTPLGGEIVAPGQQARYDLTVDVSDYFAFSDVTVVDTIPDGLLFDDTVTPTLTCSLRDVPIGPLSFTPATFSVIDNWTDYNGATAPNPGEPAEYHELDPAANDGTSRIELRISELLIAEGGDGKLVGGGIPDGGTGVGPLPNLPPMVKGATTCDLSFTVLISDRYADDYPSGDFSVDQNDVMPASAIASGTLLNVTDLTETVYSESDDSAASFAISGATLEKTVYAINGNTACLPGNCDGGTSTLVAPGDEVTFRLKMDLTTSDIEDLRIADVLPPFFNLAADADALSRISSITMVPGSTPPAVGTAQLGPDDDFFAESGITPTITNNVDAGTITFDYGSYDDPDNTPNVIDILLTVTVNFDPTADRQVVLNSMAQYEGSTNSGDHRRDASATFLLLAPDLTMRKGVIAADTTNAQPSDFARPGTFTVNDSAPCATRLGSGTTARMLPSQLTDATLNSDVDGLDAGDMLTFGLLVQNTGSLPSGAFDITLRDELPLNMSFVPGSICVHQINTNSVLSYTLIGDGLFDADGGLRIDDIVEPEPEVGAIGAGREVDSGTLIALSAEGLVLVSYQATLDADFGMGEEKTTTATLFNYASRQDGPDFTAIDLEDDVTVESEIPIVSTAVITSSETHTDDAALTVGEIARVRVAVQLPEGVHSAATVSVQLPTGMTYFDGGTATVALLSDDESGGLTSSTVAIAGLSVSGNSADIADLSVAAVSAVLPDNAVSTSRTTENDAFQPGTDVWFKFGTLTNADRDDNDEFVVIDFNVLVNNSNAAAVRYGDQLQISTDFLLDSTQKNGDAGTTVINVVEPQLTLAKTATPDGGEAGETITYTLTVENDDVSDSSSAFDLLLTDVLPSALISPTVVAVTPTNVADSGYTLVTNTLTLTATELAVGARIEVVLSAVLADSVIAGETVTNTFDVEFTSLPGAQGTADNPTGSATPGASGDEDGERNADSTSTDYTGSADAAVTIDGAGLTQDIDGSSDAQTDGTTLTIGEVVTSTIAVHLPAGQSPNLVITQSVPAGMAYVSGSQAIDSGSYNGTSLAPNVTAPGGNGADVVLNFGTLAVPADSDAANNTFTVTLQLQLLNIAGNVGFAPPANLLRAATTRVISASLRVSTLPPVNSDPLTIDVVEPELDLSLSFSDAIVDPGDPVTVTLTLTNTGTAAAYDIGLTNRLTDTLLSNAVEVSTPAGFSFTRQTATPSSGLTTVSYSGSSLAAGETVTMSYRVTLPADLQAGLRITNTAVLTQYSSLAGTVSGERSGTPITTTARVAVSAVNLAISKTDGITVTQPGASLVYTLTVSNVGNLSADGIVVTETVPANSTFDAANSSSGWSCSDGSPGGTACGFDLAGLEIDSDTELTFAVTVSATIPAGVAAITNTATVSDGGALGADDDVSDNTAQDVNGLEAAPDLEITLSDNGISPLPGQVISYTLSYSNTGNQDARGVVLRSNVPLNTTYRARGSTAGWSCANGAVGGKPCRLTIGDLAAGAGGTATLVMVVNYPFPAGVISVTHNVSIADNAANGADPTPDNNQATTVSELSPTAITLTALTAEHTDDGVLVRWATGSEVDTLGFLVFRSVSDRRSDAVQVTPQLVTARGQNGGGAAYSAPDTAHDASADALYWIVEVERSGRRLEHGPLFLAAPPPLLPQQWIPFVMR
jgi:fimbrial isopeptide formation D2 family protein/uncharacterized repeat protein (TIGR01451 family)